MKVVINNCYGGFSLSREATNEWYKRKGIGPVYWYYPGKGDTIANFSQAFLVPEEEYLAAKERSHLPGGDFTECNAMCAKSCRNIPRDDHDLIAIVEEMGEDANGQCAELRIVEIPDDVKWTIEEYDGNEWIAEVHNTWR
jgi:hypothetical protein